MLSKRSILGLFATITLIGLGLQSAQAYPPAGPMPPQEVVTISDAPAYDYGIRLLGSATTHVFTVTNTGTSPVSIQGGKLQSPFSYLGGMFPGTGGTCTATLLASQSCSVVVQFSPQIPGGVIASLDIFYSVKSLMSFNVDPNAEVASPDHGGGGHGGHRLVVRRTIKGMGVPYGSLMISDLPEYDYGDVDIDSTVTHTFTLTNTSHAPIFKIQPSFDPSGVFDFVGGSYPGTGGTCGDVILPKKSCTVVIAVTPVEEGSVSTKLQFLYKSSGGLFISQIRLKVNGLGSIRVVDLNGMPGSMCALFSNGQIKCWGLNLYGQLGLGDTQNRGDQSGQMGANLPFVDLGTGRTVKKFSKNSLYHQCVILDNNDLKCWGFNQRGQLGLGDTVTRGDQPGQMGDNLPAVNLGTGLYAVEVVAGSNFTCALLNNAKIKCWGGNDRGELGLGDTQDRGGQPGQMGNNLPFVDLGNDTDGLPYEAIDIVSGDAFTCAVLKSGNMKCWGWNTGGQLGLNDTQERGDQPGQMGNNLPFLDFGPGLTVRKATGGWSYTCVILNDDSTRCWGLNNEGQLGIGSTINQADSLARPLSNIPFVDFGAGLSAQLLSRTGGGASLCAILNNDRIKCWGGNLFGQLGLGDTQNRGDQPGEMGVNLPFVDVGTNRTVKVVALSGYATCAILDNDEVKCWGWNIFGQLGLGDTQDRGGAPGQMGDNLPYLDLL